MISCAELFLDEHVDYDVVIARILKADAEVFLVINNIRHLAVVMHNYSV